MGFQMMPRDRRMRGGLERIGEGGRLVMGRGMKGRKRKGGLVMGRGRFG